MADGDREIAPPREPIAPRSTGTVAADTSRAVAEVRAPLNGRMIAGRGIVDYVADNTPAPDLTWAQNLRPTNDPNFVAEHWGFHVDGGGNTELNTTNKSDAPTTLYGTDNPFAILADVFGRGFGQQGDSTPQTTYVPVTGGASSGGSPLMLVFLLLLVIGGGYYFFVYRKQHQHGGA